MFFKCYNCENIIQIRHLKPGESAKCKRCGSYNLVPEEEGTIGEKDKTIISPSPPKNLSESEKEILFQKWLLRLSYGIAYIFTVPILFNKIESGKMEFIIPQYSFGIAVKVVFIYIPLIIVFLGGIILPYYLLYKATNSWSIPNVFKAWSRYSKFQYYLPFLIGIIIGIIVDIVFR